MPSRGLCSILMGALMRMGWPVTDARKNTNCLQKFFFFLFQNVSSNSGKVLLNNNPVILQYPGSAAVLMLINDTWGEGNESTLASF